MKISIKKSITFDETIKIRLTKAQKKAFENTLKLKNRESSEVLRGLIDKVNSGEIELESAE